MEFMAWPSIARLNREMIITEKIDGSNAAVIIESCGVYPTDEVQGCIDSRKNEYTTYITTPAMLAGPEIVRWPNMWEVMEVGAQSRKRLLSPNDDNFGFAQWVFDHSLELVNALGEGRHYGEWWGSGIQRGYGLTKGAKRFSLFNVKRWEDDFTAYGLNNVACVPVLFRGQFEQETIEYWLEVLREIGSFAADFDRPEGIVVYHTAANTMFKVTLENDEVPKTVAARQKVRA